MIGAVDVITTVIQKFRKHNIDPHDLYSHTRESEKKEIEKEQTES